MILILSGRRNHIKRLQLCSKMVNFRKGVVHKSRHGLKGGGKGVKKCPNFMTSFMDNPKIAIDWYVKWSEESLTVLIGIRATNVWIGQTSRTCWDKWISARSIRSDSRDKVVEVQSGIWKSVTIKVTRMSDQITQQRYKNLTQLSLQLLHQSRYVTWFTFEHCI
jgi:hypothetical protein